VKKSVTSLRQLDESREHELLWTLGSGPKGRALWESHPKVEGALREE
jgi:hypothetical protein